MEQRAFIHMGSAALAAICWGGVNAPAKESGMTRSKEPDAAMGTLTYDDVRAVSPALEYYTKATLLDGLWKRPGLSPRERRVVTVVALIARIQSMEFRFHFGLALDNGVHPAELSEIITHLAFY